MEEFGEQCTVVFAYIFTKPAEGGEGGNIAPLPPHTHTQDPVCNILCEDDIALFSRSSIERIEERNDDI
jgi:hypothetical protein